MEKASTQLSEVPWEQRAGNALARYLGTFAQAIHPIRSAPAFAGKQVSPAIRFALLSAVPFAALAGVVPYTRTLLFEPGFGLSSIGEPTPRDIALDIVRAMGISVAVCLAYFLALALPYISLTRAYGRPEMRQVPSRLMLYRGWLVPLSLLVAYGSYWGAASGGTPETYLAISSIGMMLPLLLLFLAMRQTAHRICGVPTFTSFVVVIVPFVLLELVRALPIPVGLPG